MAPIDYYKKRIVELENKLKIFNNKKSRFAWYRFTTITATAGCFYWLQPYGIGYTLIPCLLLVIIFIRIVLLDIENKVQITHQKNLLLINENEIKALENHYDQFEDGKAYIPKEHAYAQDLDIFGHASVFQYINRTNAEMGSELLADWLLNPANPHDISERQAAVKELITKTEWRQELEALGKAQKIRSATQQRLYDWFKEENRFIDNKIWSWLSFGVPGMLLLVIGLNITDIVSNHFRNYCLLAAGLFALYMSKKIAPLHQQVSKMTDELEVLKTSIKLIENTNFSSPLLQKLQAACVGQKGKASDILHQLKKILERLDLRFNFVVFIPIDILLQWDLQQVLALEKWKQHNRSYVLQWFNALATYEAINSLSTTAFNHPEWCFPQIKNEHFFIEGKDIGHPLIVASKCVTNPINIEKKGKLMLITGSNMAGKSTYLRSIGVNTVLAMAGSAVCASYFCISPVQIISSMRIADNLEESTSTFYAELKKLKRIIDQVNNHQHIFILLDEILRGTNSMDRHTGSAALIKQLIKQNAACIIATHDLELANMKTEFPENLINYHFDVQVNQDELYFDYKLKSGICNSLNASILMKKIGIEL